MKKLEFIDTVYLNCNLAAIVHKLSLTPSVKLDRKFRKKNVVLQSFKYIQSI